MDGSLLVDHALLAEKGKEEKSGEESLIFRE